MVSFLESLRINDCPQEIMWELATLQEKVQHDVGLSPQSRKYEG